VFKKLKQIWSYSDSQPTEITLAMCNLLLTHLAVGLEIGGLWFLRVMIVISALYQLYCVSQEDISCRVKAAMITFGIYTTVTIIYLIHIGLPTPTHWGWFVLMFASFGSMRRLILEKIHKDLKDG
jgi:hypothetical protein